MHVVGDLVGKEVVDSSGDRIGEVKDVDIVRGKQQVKSLVIKEGGAATKIGMGEKKVIPCNQVDTIREKVMLKSKVR
jgi:sporulation protein YlmC with PRC-barrel domain